MVANEVVAVCGFVAFRSREPGVVSWPLKAAHQKGNG